MLEPRRRAHNNARGVLFGGERFGLWEVDMRVAQLGGTFALAVMLAAVQIGPAAAELQISKCKTRALIGAAGGALVGSMIAGKGDKTEGALIGGALGAAGTFGVCKWMDARTEKQAQLSYDAAAKSNKASTTTFKDDKGVNRTLTVSKPVKTSSNCRQMNSTLSVPGQKAQAMPPQTYCQGADGVWRPA
jgi:hypothetical protein